MKWHGRRALLNQPGHQSTAAIVAEIEDTSVRPRKKLEWVESPNYTLQISDCDRSIRFDLDFTDKESMANNLFKVDAMIEALSEFRGGLVTEHKRQQARQARHARR